MSSLRRFFVSKVNNPLIIDGEEFNHAVNVLRIKELENVIVCDNTGIEYTCKVEKINKKNMQLSVLSSVLSNTETKEEVTLLAGYLKGDKTELVVQKAVELGVKKIIIFNSEYSSAYMSENKLARLNKVSVESAKQCGRAIAPKVEYFDKFEDALKSAGDCKNKTGRGAFPYWCRWLCCHMGQIL